MSVCNFLEAPLPFPISSYLLYGDRLFTSNEHLHHAFVLFGLCRFHSGPPYEDVAFKIINSEWDMNKRSGFKCIFERGVLQVHFNFKRHWYRR